jgi:hypothetical protein
LPPAKTAATKAKAVTAPEAKSRASELEQLLGLALGDGRLPTIAEIEAERARRAERSVQLTDQQVRARDNHAAREHLIKFVERTTQDYVTGWVHEELCAELEQFYADVAAKKAPRLIVTIPPQVGKSKIISCRAPIWAFGRYPGMNVMLTTYGQLLANTHSRDARECARSGTVAEIFPDIRPKRAERTWYADYRRNDVDQVVEWKVGGPVDAKGFERRSSFKAVGVGGAATGFPVNAMVIDDPFKDGKEADSQQRRDDVDDWLQKAGRTRLAAGAGICIVMTRWHADDTVGRRLKIMEQGGETWRVVNFPAIAEQDEYSRFDNRLLRKAGESVHEVRRPLHEYLALRGQGSTPGTVDEYTWASLFQQRPIPESGGIIKPSDLRNRYVELPAKISRRIMSLDTATSPDPKADWTVLQEGVESGVMKYLAGVYRQRLDFPDLLSLTRSRAAAFNPDVVLIEDKSSGRQLWQMLENPVHCPDWRWPIIKVKPEEIGNKKRRLSLETPCLRAGQLWLPEWAEWLPDWMAEVLGAPRYATWDQADAFSQWLRYIRENPENGSVVDILGRW